MAVRAHKTKKNTWVIDYYPAGRNSPRVRRMFKGTEQEAQAVESELRGASVMDAPIEINPKILDIIPDWLTWYETNRLSSTHDDVTACSVHLRNHFGTLQFRQITPAIIEQYKIKRLGQKEAHRTINKELTYLSSLVKFAVKNCYAKSLPFKIEKFENKLTKAPAPVLPLPEQIEALIACIEPEYQPLILLLYDGGLRRSEAMSIKSEDVYLDRGIFRVLGKGNKERFVPITTERLLMALARLKQEISTGFLFLNTKTGRPFYSIRKAILRAAIKAGINEKDKPARVRLYHHLFRHSFGTYALESGVDMRALQGILGHSSIKTTEIYAHLRAEYLRREGTKFGAFIHKSLEASKSNTVDSCGQTEGVKALELVKKSDGEVD